MADKKIGVYSIVINAIRILLIVGLFIGLQNDRKLLMVMSIIGLFITFIPFLLKKAFHIESPIFIEIIIIAFVYGSLFLVDVRGLFPEFIYWDVFLNFIAAIALGLIGLSVMYALYRGKIISTNPFIMSAFAFCFAVSIGILWEIFEFLLDSGFGFILQKSAEDTMVDLIVVVFGALFLSLIGYNYLIEGKSSIFSSFLVKLIGRNRKFFGSGDLLERSSQEILLLIKKGESEKLEFKSSLRTNLYTGVVDRNIEHGVLKTIVAYLNSNGGTLLVGVSDSGEIIGLEKDKFKDNDALKLHFTNLIRQHIGGEFMHIIDFELFPVEDKHVLKIDCTRSDKRVFLKVDKEEEFYIRNGPSSVRLNGNSLIEYIEHRF